MCISACRNTKCNKCVPFGSISAFHYSFLKICSIIIQYNHYKIVWINQSHSIANTLLHYDGTVFFIWFCPWNTSNCFFVQNPNANFHFYMTWQKQWIYIHTTEKCIQKNMPSETPTSITRWIHLDHECIIAVVHNY